MIPARTLLPEERIARDRKLLIIVLLLVLVLTITELFLIALSVEHASSSACPATARPSLPCAAIPTQFMMQDPACAQKLLEAMNVTNFRILTNASQLPDLDPAMKEKLAELRAFRRGNRSPENSSA